MEKRISLIAGWLVFALSFLVYILTLEPTISYWDCSEFITCANRMEVGHAPGAPVFMILGRVFSLFAGNNISKIAFFINLISALASAFTIMFLFWTIEWFGKKLNKNLKKTQSYLHISFAAFIGSMAFAFTDSFWFSAVEGEVYATSSFLSALVFWLILKWETKADEAGSDKWILLILFLMGLSIGIHLLNLLAIPAIILIYYFKKYKTSTKDLIKVFLFSFLILLFLVFVFIPGIVKLAAYFDLLFVNTFNLPVYSGVLFYIVLLIGGIVFLLKYSIQHKKQLINTIVMSVTVFLLGYSSFTTLVISSLYNSYIDINNVENIFGLVDYLNREQYGKRPLIYGNNYNSPIEKSIERSTYKLFEGKYVKKELNSKYVFNKNSLTLFPRMASLDEAHASIYEQWINIKGKKVKITNREGKQEIITIPTFRDNVAFFLKYQLGYMYFRYLMWNFSGRQNNIQGTGGLMDGNWISGIPLMDNTRLGLKGEIPGNLKNNPAHNTYYMLPFILGLAGLFFQYKKDKNNFLVSFSLFILTGVAIVVYLNEIPITPRERDYAFTGSFYVFSIWIGLSFLAISHYLKIKKKFISITLLTGFIALLPLLLLKENWDDHDRSGRFIARDFSMNYLKSCEKNAILFTASDNDTYPVWYAQEVERYRRDVRAILSEFLPVDWYINQLGNNYLGMGQVPLSFSDKDFLMGKRLYLPVINRVNSWVDANEIIDFVKSDHKGSKLPNQQKQLDYIPAKKIKIPVNKENFIKSCQSFSFPVNEIPDYIYVKINSNYLFRDDLLILDIILNNKWERPLYFLNPNQLAKLGLGKYLYREGLAYRLLPFSKDSVQAQKVNNTQYQYQKFMTDFEWGGVGDEDVMLDWTIVRRITLMQLRENFAHVAKQLIKDGKQKNAIEVLDKCMELFPSNKVPYAYSFPNIIEAYYLAGNKTKSKQLYNNFKLMIVDELEYYKNLDKKDIPRATNNIRKNLYMLQQIQQIKTKPENDNSHQLLNQYYEYFYKLLV